MQIDCPRYQFPPVHEIYLIAADDAGSQRTDDVAVSKFELTATIAAEIETIRRAPLKKKSKNIPFAPFSVSNYNKQVPGRTMTGRSGEESAVREPLSR